MLINISGVQSEWAYHSCTAFSWWREWTMTAMFPKRPSIQNHPPGPASKPSLFPPSFNVSGADSEVTIGVFRLRGRIKTGLPPCTPQQLCCRSRTHIMTLHRLPHLCPLRHAPMGSRRVLQITLVRAHLATRPHSRIRYPVLVNVNPIS
jgi:hypothetical protein